MKRTLTLIATLVLVLGAGTALSAADNLKATIKFQGKVEILAKDGSWIPAKNGQAIADNTTINTGFRSTAEVSLGNSIVTIKPLTRITLKFSSDFNTVDVNLRVGKVAAEVKGTAGKVADFKVKSSISTASVRGTGFEFDGEYLKVIHGFVDFSDNLGNLISVPRGEAAKIDPRGGGMTDNKDLVSEESDVSTDAGADFEGDGGFGDDFGDFTEIDDFSELIDFDDLVDDWNDYLNEVDPPTGNLVIIIE